MKLDSMRSSLIGGVFVIAAAALLGSCGGGGAASPGPVGGPPQILPAAATLYGGVEYTFTIAGGRTPYNLSSSEPALLPVPTVLNGNFFNVTPANPGVYDIGLPDDALPVRTVTITSRDAVGSTAATSGITVAINFMTGYGVSYTSNCSAPQSGAPPAACAGGETTVHLTAVVNGNLHGNRQYKFEILRGPISWFFPANQNQGGTIVGNIVNTNTDHSGNATVFFRTNANVPTQVAVFRVTDVVTGASVTHVLTIAGTPVNGALEILPDQFTFTGPNTATCGTGTGDFFVFDGVPPYTAVTSTANLSVFGIDPSVENPVTPARSTTQPGRFRLSATNPNVCLSGATIVVTDANNNRGTVTVDTEAGSGAPPPNPISVTPGSITLDCGQAGSFVVLGGPTSGGTFTVTMPGIVDPRITAVASGRNITVTRTPGDVPVPPLAPRTDMNFTFTVTDTSNNTNTTTFGVTAPTACPHS